MTAQVAVPSLSRRLLTAGASALVLMLTVFAASPDLHAQVHDNGVGHDDSGCVIALFGHGVSLASGTDALVVALVEWRTAPPLAGEELLLTAPRYLRQPERGPPVS